MAYVKPFLRVVFSGTHFTSEQFSFGLSFIDDFGTGVAPTEVPAGLITAAQNFMAQPIFSTASKMDLIKVNLIGTDGRYVSQDDTVLAEINPPAAGPNAPTQAPQVALAVTLDTGARRGRAARGRFYLPSPTWPVGTDGRISAGHVDTTLAAVGTFLDGVEASLPGWDLGVVSDIGTGAQKAVTSIRIGRVYDTIRSRRTSLDETYTLPREHVEA